MIGLEKGQTLTRIARQLNRALSTISREVRRHGVGRGYRAHRAEQRARDRRAQPRRRSKLNEGFLRGYVDAGLRQYWSPEQIAGRLRREFPSDPARWVSHETIYRYIMVSARAGRSYEMYLRHGRRRHRYGWRGKQRYKRIRDYKKIDERPAVVAERSRIGDWESDTVRGPHWQQAGIATHVERKTRYLVAVKLTSRKAAAYNQATIAALQALTGVPVKTLTVDNGMEFSQFKEMEVALATAVYFATPYHAWERGQNENANGLLRQFFPKRMNLSSVTPQEVAHAQWLLNHRPRKCLDYRTPAEALQSELLALGY